MVPWMWAAQLIGLSSLALLFVPAIRRQNALLGLCCVGVIVGIWIDKGLGMVCGGFIPNPLGEVTEYWPSGTELMIGLGIYGLGALILTVFYKMALSERELRDA